MQFTCLRKSGRKWDRFCQALPQTAIGGVLRRPRRLVGTRAPRLIRENSEPRRIRKLLEITARRGSILVSFFKEWPRNARKALGCVWCRGYKGLPCSVVSMTKNTGDRQTPVSSFLNTAVAKPWNAARE